jgi:peptide/nickel transport system substrate-binding protein
MKHHARRRIIILAIAALTVAGCGGSGDSGGSPASGQGGKVKQGGTFRIAANDGIDSMNPFTAINSDSHNAFQNLYSFLVQYDTKTFDYVGDLATKWTPKKKGADWEFKIREGVKWSDGQPLDATDIADVMNWATKQDGLGLVGEIFGGHLKRAEAPDPTTLVLHYDQPIGVVLSKMAKWPILPPQVWTKFKDAKAAGAFQNTKPVVSGPFTVTKYAKRDVLITKANPDYYGKKPIVDGWGLKQYQNVDAQLQALANGEIDAVEAVPGSNFASLKRNGSLTVVNTPSSFVSDFIINANPNKTTHRELLDPQVREAFAHAIDKPTLVKLIHAGKGKPADSLVPEAYGKAPETDQPWHASGLPQDSFDLAKANQILDGLGYKKGAGGVRTAKGHPMSYSMIVPTDAYTGVTRVADLFKRWFGEIGVKLSVRPLDSGAAYNEIIGSDAPTKTPKNSYKKFDLALWNWTSRPDAESIMLVATTSQYGSLNDSGYANPRYDKLYEQQFTEVDQGKRVELIQEMQRIMAKDRPYIPLVFADKLQAWNKKWVGLQPTPQGFFNESSNANLLEVHQTG